MEDEEMKQKFIQWLAQKTGAKTEGDLKKVMTELQSNKPLAEKFMQEFQDDMASGQPTMQKRGGRISYLKCLSEFKKGGKVNCGCTPTTSKKEGGVVPKAFLGAILGAINGAGAIAKGGTSAIKGASTLAKIGKAASGIQKVAQTGTQVLGALKKPSTPSYTATTTNTIGDKGYVSAPNINTPTMPSFSVGMVKGPNQIPGGQVLYQGNAASVDNIPRYKPAMEKGSKLKIKNPKK